MQLACFVGEGGNVWGEGSHDSSSETCLPPTATFVGLVGKLLGSSCLVPHLLKRFLQMGLVQPAHMHAEWQPV